VAPSSPLQSSKRLSCTCGRGTSSSSLPIGAPSASSFHQATTPRSPCSQATWRRYRPAVGFKLPIEVIGQASEDLTETGVLGSGSSGSSGSGGLVDASSIAKRVDSGLVDINVTLNGNEEAAGAGMVLTSKGEVLTNNHVVEGATSISVTDVGSGRTYGAKFVGYDRTSDVAVLQLERASGLKTVSLGSSSGVSTGEAVVGIGNAGGSGGTPSYAGGSVVASASPSPRATKATELPRTSPASSRPTPTSSRATPAGRW